MLDIASKQVGREDRVIAFSCSDMIVLAVADGAGGIVGGVEAAEYFISFVKHAFSSSIHQICPEALIDIFSEVDHKIAQCSSAGETTGVVTVIQDEVVFGASVGDSESWLIGEYSVDALTDHQIRKPLLGSGGAQPISFGAFSLPLSYALILGTDGLFKYATAQDIESHLRLYDANECLGRLLDLVRYPSGNYPDDIGMIICKRK